MNMFFVFDEWSDASPPDEVAKQAAIIMDALRNPHTPRPKDEWVGGEVTGQCVTRVYNDCEMACLTVCEQILGTRYRDRHAWVPETLHRHVRPVYPGSRPAGQGS